ncbi:RHS repeat-associated core domain-containing protein [Kutzneria sp. NPDC051319]|uniref:RHS repeat-associated core domain-containing protein n=1 Tax=Kutzneria sp. NPDC051319 TaxID=3155047 RepID=UPI0034332FAE
MRRLRRVVAGALPAALAAGALALLTPSAAWAGEPSVPLPGIASTPVSQQQHRTDRPTDQATSSELHGNQPSSSAKDGGGLDTATPLSQSASWSVAAQTGDFSWSYPMRVPPSAGGLDPTLSLNYKSSSVDGRTSATNNQASWVGDGWDLGVGFIERSYIPCANDVKPVKNVGDMCWRSDNATASYGGGGGQLVRDDKTGVWKNKEDDGSRIERLTGAGNGDNDGEYWRITTVDGTQYFFGDRADAKSTWTVPVFGNDDGEPCHAAAFADSHCVQAWRWNLDKVVDRHGNVIQYNYDAETNSYGLDVKDAAASYTRGGTLKEALYGIRDGQPATGRVQFTTADRCVPGSDCTADKKDNWPDVPWDDKCDTATCKGKYSPTFWSTKRLAKVTTQVLSGSSFSDVESWTLDQQFPASGDGEKAALWLKSVTDSAGSVSDPPVRFEGTKFPNRVDTVDGLGPLLRYRLTGIVSESGGVTTITYGDPDCTATSRPANPESNSKRCFPMTWAKKDFSERTDYFNKYVVAKVAQSDMIAGNLDQVTAYDYLDGAGWAYDTSEFSKEADRTWNDFRGYDRVRVTKGRSDDLDGPQTMTETRYYRGLNGDKLPSGARSVTVADSEGGVHQDDAWLQGFNYESQAHNGTSEQVLAKSIITPSVKGPLATRAGLQAYQVNIGSTLNYVAVSSGGWRTTQVDQAYDDYQQLVSTNDLGDTSTAADDRCTRVSYARDTDKWFMAFPAGTETVSVACDKTPSYPDNAMAASRITYNDKGDVTKSEALDSHPAAGAKFVTTGTADYDVLGRVTSSSDALGRPSSTAYTPSTGGPLTQVVATNALGQSVTTTVDPAFGNTVKTVDANNRTTEVAYDAMGRKTEVWLPNRTRAPGVGGNTTFAYAIRDDAPSVITTTKIGPNGNYVSSNQLFDGLLRLRQTQRPATGGGRLITDAKYDSQGRQFKVTQPYFTDAPVDDRLWIASDVDVPLQTADEYDGLGRPTAEIVKGGAFEKWRTVTSYDADRSTVTPPAGGIPTTSIMDGRGNVVELRQYHGAQPNGDYDVTKYSYTPTGKLATITDPAGNTWHKTYDLHGNLVRDEDADTGITTSTYNAANELASTTSSRGTTLTYDYDELGRKIDSKIGDAVQSQWTYDTALFGVGEMASSTRYVDGHAYTATTGGYDSLYHATSTQLTVPDSEGALAGTYTNKQSFNWDGSARGVTYAAAGDLPVEPLSYTYDDLGELLTTTGGYDGNTFDYVTDTQYTRYGEVQRVQLGDTGKRTWLSTHYDDHTRRIERTIIDAEVPSPMQSDTHYSYDDYGDLTSIADTPQGKPADVQCFKQDYLHRLTEAWTPAGDCSKDPSAAALSGPAPYWQSFSYDKAGNRTTQTQHSTAGDTVTTSTYPAAGHKVSSTATTGPAGASSTEYVYDAAGNTVSRKLPGSTQQLDWDAEGHLAKVTQGGNVTDFVYDAEGDRLIRHDNTGATLYLAGEEIHVAKGGNVAKGTRYYQYGARTIGMRDAAGLTWLAPDFQGTSQVAIDSGSLKVTQRRQTPYGQPRGPTVNFPGDKGFVGGTEDTSIGLTELGAREYDSAQGRFLSTDPVMKPGSPQQLNPYGYANGNPVNLVDDSGLTAGSWCATPACAAAGADSPGLSGYGIYPSSSPQHVTPHGPGPVYKPVSTHVAADSRVAQHLRELYSSWIGKNAPALKPGEEIPSDVEAAAWKDICSAHTKMCANDGMMTVISLGMLEPGDDTELYINACAVENECGDAAGAIFADGHEAINVGGNASGEAAPKTVNLEEIPADIQLKMEQARNSELIKNQSDPAKKNRAVTAHYDPQSATWAVGCSGNGDCAEGNAMRANGFDPSKPEERGRGMFISTIRMQDGDVVTKHVCWKCQGKYPPTQFTKGVLGTPNGDWPAASKAPTRDGPGPQLRGGSGGPFAQEPIE